MGHNIVNVNVFNFQWDNAFPIGELSPSSNTAFDRLDTQLTDIFALAGLSIRSDSQATIQAGGCVFPPSVDDSSHPEGSLRTEGGKIVTPGGYTIEATKQHEWIITGPDGRTTRIWGDPHVAEGDGGKWDFKRNSTFVLADGTRINVTTAPWNDGKMTVTSSLEIINGNERVNVTGIDKGKGETGEVTRDGFAHSNCFGGSDVFVMGSETDDWSYQGREVTGSKNGGESFELGNELAAGEVNGNGSSSDVSQSDRWIREFLRLLIGEDSGPIDDRGRLPFESDSEAQFLRDSMQLVARMMDLMERLFGMGSQFYAGRNRSIYA